MPMEMLTTVIVALITGVTAVVGAVLANNKSQAVLAERVDRSNELLHHKIDRLSDRVDKHNSVVERTYKMEVEMATMWRRQDELRETVTGTREER